MTRRVLRVARYCAVSLAFCVLAHGQVCRLSVAGLNRDRRVIGAVAAECPPSVHSAPFGNWGASSNFGSKLNGHQFQGWCHDMRVCDNTGKCMSNCSDGWYEWNSCTSDPLFQAPNCTLYNAADCTSQISPLGINVLGTQVVELPVSCPRDSDLDGVVDSGGCKDLKAYTRDNNFMSLYELDPLATDELVQTLYFPPTVVRMSCDILQCSAAGSEWVKPETYDSPSDSPRVFAEMAMVVNSGSFLDPGRVCRPVASTLSAVSAASFQSGLPLAPDSIVTLFGSRLAEVTEAPRTTPLPLRLAGVQVVLNDSQGKRLVAPLLFASPAQINCILPSQTASGSVNISVEDATGVRSTGVLQVSAVGPSVFTANNDGKGVPAAVAVRVAPNGRQTAIDVFRCSAGAGSCEPSPINLNPAGDVVLSLFGTGIRGRTALENIQATIGDVPVEVLYAGPQPQFAGLDQVNVRIPRALEGSGTRDLRLLVDTKPSNTVTVRMQ